MINDHEENEWINLSPEKNNPSRGFIVERRRKNRILRFGRAEGSQGGGANDGGATVALEPRSWSMSTQPTEATLANSAFLRRKLYDKNRQMSHKALPYKGRVKPFRLSSFHCTHQKC